MTNEVCMKTATKKEICNFIIENFKARSCREWVQCYQKMFNTETDFYSNSKRMICKNVLDYMYNDDRIDEFFTKMFSIQNIRKELRESNSPQVTIMRKKAIKIINDYLTADDLELVEIGEKLVLNSTDNSNCVIGSGGFADIFVIQGKNVVQKKLKYEFQDNPGVVSRFKNEFNLMKNKLIGINGIMRVYDFNEENNSYTMDYYKMNLKNYIINSNIDETSKTTLILDILKIMKEVHERCVLHRDLSPNNIFINKGNPIIADFGLGKDTEDNERTYITADTAANGTIPYCDPRQFQSLANADVQSDIYSLGKIINFIMTKDPDNSSHAFEQVASVATKDINFRYHFVQEMIDEINGIIKNKNDLDYISRCEKLIETEYYDNSMNDYLLSFDAIDLINKINDNHFRKVYAKFISNPLNDEIAIKKFNQLLLISKNPIGYDFSLFDALSNFCLDMLVQNKGVSSKLKRIFGQCIYSVIAIIDRWNAQDYFREKYRAAESEYIQETIKWLTKK